MRTSSTHARLCFLTFGKAYGDLSPEERVQWRQATRTATYYRHHAYNTREQRRDKQFRKRDVLKALGWPAVCQRCGYDKCIAALDFHHKDPAQKESSVLAFGLERQLQEAAKCELICSNCHREHHYRTGEPKKGQRTGRPRKPLSPVIETYLRHAGIVRP